jgi:poly(3-hydroxybutyrate) depolymerase
MQGLLNLNILQKPLHNAFDAASLLALLYLLTRPAGLPRGPARAAPAPDREIHDVRLEDRRHVSQLMARSLLISGVVLVSGALIGVITLYVCEGWLNVFGIPLDQDTHAWVLAAFGGIALALANLARTRWRRKLVALASVLVFLVTAALGINAGYGLNPTLGALLGLSTGGHVALPKLNPKQNLNGPLWKTWKAPAGMPAVGRNGPVSIPAAISGFHAREAHVYLPPAALVPNPPALPVLIMMMGQPGGPDQDRTAVKELNSLARSHHGLGPILLTIDQLGNPFHNPVCVDSDSGHVYTYVTTDVVNFIHKNLNVDRRRTQWAVGGYSNGGECALSFGAKRPDLFGSILDISGELEPLNGTESNTVSTIFKGNREAFAAEEPANILKKHRYSNELAIFTSGTADPVYTPQAATAAAEAAAAGITTRRFVGPGIGHRADALEYGVKTGLPLLYARFGLTPP